ncbi:MAG: aldehyde dehydrogenase family protein [Planctomycetota bacterium]|nr:MAG: aldehyde dehydrogenase family protein [Planctomycetota bacterium]
MTTTDLGHESTSPSRVAQAFWTYAPAPESMKVEIADRYGHFIAGRFREAADHFESINPATEQVLCEVGQGSVDDVDAAVKAAREALPSWSSLPGKERGKYLFRIARRIQERARELAVLETTDGGKPIKESRDIDIPLSAAHFFYHAGWADKLAYAFAGRTPKPVGVCGQIIPWNFPLLMAAWKIAPALACGNTVVLKPAETTPLTALRLAEIVEEIGLPPGVLNIVTGDGRTGEAIVKHPGIDKIAFTGSTEIGKRIAHSVAEEMRQTGRQKRLTLELGGKSPHIIFEDASLDQAVEGVVRGIFFNQGHVCCAGSRLLVQESILEPVLEKLRLRMSTLRVGDPMDKNTDVGAINSKQQLEIIERYIRTGLDEGARLCVPARLDETSGAASHECEQATGGFEKGYYCRPCFFAGVQPSQTIAREEIFGPVLAVLSFRTPEEAIARANNTRYGLAAGVWTDKGSKIFEMASRLQSGVVWLNTYNQFDPTSPFGGYKESGFGREGGLHGLRAYVSLQ